MSKELVIRLAGRGQYQVPAGGEDLLKELNRIDNEIVARLAQAQGDLQELLEQMESRVLVAGERIDDLVSSDLILPPEDLTLAEAAELFHGEGIIPR
jgi:hypothetical protein